MTPTTTPELIHLDPNAIDIEDNVRLDPRLDRDFLASIQEHGVLNPVLAVRIEGRDNPVVREGQRRIQAARQVGLSTVPVYVRTVRGDDTAVRTQRVIEQIVVNDRRAPLTEAERARGINQLLLDGISPTKVAKSLSTTKDAVAAAQVAIDSEQTMTALDAGQLTLVEATRFAEFDGDDESQAELIKVAGTDQFDHRVAQLRADREDRRRYTQAAHAYAAKGYTVLDERPGWYDKTYISAHNLKDPSGQALTDERIADMDPRHWAVWLDSTEAYVDAQTGDLVDEDEIDFDTAEDPDREPAESYRHSRTVREATVWEPNYFCCDLAGAGVTMPDWLARQHGVDLDALTDATDPDGAAERERAREEHAEKERAERKKLIALNKLGQAAESVRREWVRDNLLSRKTAPKGAALFLAQVVATTPYLFDDYHGKRVARELLGLADDESPEVVVSKLPATGDGRALVILLGMVLGTMEAKTSKDAWRRADAVTKNYLRFLDDNDYPLSDVEQVVLGKRKADALYRQITKDAQI
jgi:ParB family chromosome partitioning protein